MASLKRKSYTRPLPQGSEIVTHRGQRVARWVDSNGKKHTASVTVSAEGTERIRVESAVWTAKFRDADDRTIEASTGCRDKDAAMTVLRDTMARVEKQKAGILSRADVAVAGAGKLAMDQHLRDFSAHLRSGDVCNDYHDLTMGHLRVVCGECGFAMLRDLDSVSFERWLVKRSAQGMSARTRNSYRQSLVTFCNWCVQVGRLVSNPFLHVPRANEHADQRRKRRALTEEEMVRLLETARRRPFEEKLLNRGSKAKLSKSTTKRLERLGQERALIYKTLMLTGLRRKELASVTAGQVHLDGDSPHIVLHAADEKARRGALIPLRDDLADDLRQWLVQGVEVLRGHSNCCTVALHPETPLFNVPDALGRILDRDLKVAGIPKRDQRGRTVDVHALRHTFATHLSKGGVPLRTAQAAMRHSDPKLTAVVYTDPALLDVRGALDALPRLPLERPEEEKKAVPASKGLPPVLAPAIGPPCQRVALSGSSAVADACFAVNGDGPTRIRISPNNDRPLQAVSPHGKKKRMERDTGFEPATSSLGSWHSAN